MEQGTTSEIEQWRAVQDMLRGYRAAQILMTCQQLEIFRHLAAGPRAFEALADLTGSHPEALRRLLNAAVALGLLHKDGETYANSPLATTCLVEEGPFFLGRTIRMQQAGYERWGRLLEAVHTGRWPEINRQIEGRANWVRDFELAMYDMARVSAPAIAEALSLPTDRPLRLIDVGGGHGGYSMALARRYPNLTAIVFELPAAAEVARDIIAAEAMSQRVTVQAGDFQQEELGSGYDVALIFGVLVSETEEGKSALLRKAHAALSPGGIVVIREFWFNPDDPAQSPEAALFSLHTLLANSVGDVASLAQMQTWLLEAGFEQPSPVALPEWLGSSLCVAYKPEQKDFPKCGGENNVC
jgi:2-polyprenyl-3-methyl-5-hydroxy-6-metoxy-1,4-benzoquinol methylase